MYRGLIRGRAWVFGDNIDTDQIIPAQHLSLTQPQQLARYAFQNLRPDFWRQAKPGDLILAGANFGCGSSREHAVLALKGLGISCVIAKSFARIFYRNCINNGLPPIQAELKASDGDRLEVNLVEGTILNRTTGVQVGFQPFPELILEILRSGGLVEYVKRRYRF